MVIVVPAIPVDPFTPKHAYRQVADDVARRIESGEIRLKLPAERALAEEYGAAYTTVRRAMEVLREQGLIVTIHGRGTFVAASLSSGPGRWIGGEHTRGAQDEPEY